ncbi:hypothetical protein D7V88_21070 [Corallococcus terminator]|uniref:Uncharacterized protein n=1 Tax=Corallococcus terminator TaxID=2316733 RepID=A0A3A8IN41_9BACT|nr:hypothetical protein D7V88_21070 [Corallococcus terminator]
MGGLCCAASFFAQRTEAPATGAGAASEQDLRHRFFGGQADDAGNAPSRGTLHADGHSRPFPRPLHAAL